MLNSRVFQRSDDSPASFEKALETISTRIGKTQIGLERKRVNLRRALFTCTLYPAIVYIVFAIVELLVVKPANIGIAEWAGIVGGPFLSVESNTTVTQASHMRPRA
jgi:endoplasmic reticulum junction formation protein lunapark